MDEPKYIKLAFFEGPRKKILAVSKALGLDTEWMDWGPNKRKRKFRITITEHNKVTEERYQEAKEVWRED